MNIVGKITIVFIAHLLLGNEVFANKDSGLWSKEAVPAGRFNEFLVDRFRTEEAFSQDINISEIQYVTDKEAYLAHTLYSLDNSTAIRFKVTFYASGNISVRYDYLVKNAENQLVSELSEEKYRNLNPKKMQMSIDLKDETASYFLDNKVIFRVPILHSVVRMGTRYSGAEFEFNTHNPD